MEGYASEVIGGRIITEEGSGSVTGFWFETSLLEGGEDGRKGQGGWEGGITIYKEKETMLRNDLHICRF